MLRFVAPPPRRRRDGVISYPEGHMTRQRLSLHTPLSIAVSPRLKSSLSALRSPLGASIHFDASPTPLDLIKGFRPKQNESKKFRKICYFF
ncbi:hypothetical protein EYF80_025247 [Liparis tanakae]|uniref:Uncharacterized protein n=1 Tax=Liparis tanakae TaxID=230148 RepID=A0A4Z2HF81_9TELE|nr:hypothetical protein EYF80_025247 [Liparis tanakae]